MCTIAILIDVVDGAPLVLAANRDEMYARPTRAPEVLAPGIAGGVDVLSGGTWLAVRADGRFAAVTNQRALAPVPPGLRSRGLAVRELAAATDPDAYVAALDPAAYASMNLVWTGPHGTRIAYSRREQATLEVEPLGRGIHALCNDRLGAAGYPRCERLTDAIAGAVDRTAPPFGGAAGRAQVPAGDRGVGWPALAAQLAVLLGDHTLLPLADTPPSHLPPEVARALTATCIHTPAYGTRSSTIVALAPGRVLDYLHADGPPCTTPFVDCKGLLA